MAPPRPGSLAVVTWEGEEVAGEVIRVDATHAVVAVRIPHDSPTLIPRTGSVVWADGREQAFTRAQATAMTVIEITLPLIEVESPEGRAEVHVRRRVALDVRDPRNGRLVATGHTRTLSGAGGRIEVNRPLQTHERYRLALYLPDGLAKVDAVVLNGDSQGHAIVTFLDVAPAVQEQLDRYVRESLRALRRRRKPTA